MKHPALYFSAILVLTACPNVNSSTGTVSSVVDASSGLAETDAGGSSVGQRTADAGGLARAELIPIVMAGRASAYTCFRDVADCAARATFRVGSSGGVVEVRVERISGGPLEPGVATCLESVINRWRFPDAGSDTWVSHIWECKKD